jgi:hypothetical protein
MQFNGGIIGKLVTPSSNAASGIWPLFQLENAVLSSNWPKEAVTITGVTILPTDVYFPSVTLLLKTAPSSFTGKSTTTIDSSTNNFTVTRNGTPLTAWTGPYQTDGYWSNYFNGTSAYFSIGTQPILNVGTGNFTIECFIFFPGRSTTWSREQILASTEATQGSGVGFSINGSTQGSTGISLYVAGTSISSTAAISANTWHHVAAVRNSGTVTIYVDGISVVSGSAAASISSAASYNIGALRAIDPTYNDIFQGYISNLRITSTAVYTGRFTPPTGPLATTQSAGTNIAAITGTQTTLLTCQSNRFKDSSTNNFSLTVNGTPTALSDYYPSGFTVPTASPSAVYFNGSTDYLTYNQTFALGTNDFTLEFWMYVPVNPVYPTNYWLWGWRNNTDNCPGMYLNAVSGGGNTLWFTGNLGFISNPSSIPTNTWTHIAIVRSGSGSNNLKMYINGVQVAQVTNTQNFTYTGTQPIGANPSGNGALYPSNVYISNFRIVNGTAVYTGNFTPPSNFVTQTGGTYSNTANINTSIASSNTTLLLNFAESNYTSSTTAIQNNVFVDDSNYAATITRNGTPAQGSVTPYWPSGQWSNYFDGSNSYIRTTGVSFTNPSFTIECWFYFAGSPANQAVYDFSATIGTYGVFTSFNGSNLTTSFYSTSSSASSIGQINTPYTNYLNKWVHLAVTFDGVTYRMFLNGVSVGTPVLSSTQIVTVTVLTVGGRSDSTQVAGYGWVGYVSNFRYVRGTAVYTGNFVPPTSPLTAIANTVLLTAQDNRFKDNSINKFTITPSGAPTTQVFQPFPTRTQYSPSTHGGSAYFNGSTDYLSSTTASTVMQFGTGAYTVDGWIYQTSRSGTPFICGGVFSGNGFQVNINASGYINFSIPGFSGSTPATIAIPLNTWTHFALVRTSTATSGFAYYINGAAAGIITDANNYSGTATAINVGTTNNSSLYMLTGYLSNFRIVKGTAVYTGAFTPPTEPLTKITNTSLLLNFTNAAIYDATTQNNLISVGDAQSSNVQSKWSPSSMKFDGTGDYLLLPDSVNLQLGSGDYTIEFWLYPVSLSGSFSGIIDTRTSGGVDTNGFVIYFGTSQLRFRTNGSDILTYSSFPTGAWTYVAITRSGSGSNNTKLFINGTQQAQATNTTSFTQTSRFAIGTTYPLSGDFYNGYIQDLRLTKGVARTVTTVPTTEFETLGVNSLSPPTVDYLVVGGGGGGGAGGAGGGGAGGMLTSTAFTITSGTSYLVTVGSGGAGGYAGDLGPNQPGSGISGSSSIFSSITAMGGGGGGGWNSVRITGADGGSGGGGAARTGYAGGKGIVGQGNDGGISLSSATSVTGRGGGGGGANTAGASGDDSGNGGNGLSSSITGSPVTYAGGGGGGGFYPPANGTGGTGGGGPGGYQGSGGTAGTANLGGGGGGGGSAGSYPYSSPAGGNGGSGVVVIAYANTYSEPIYISGGLTYEVTTRSGYIVYKFINGTGTIKW